MCVQEKAGEKEGDTKKKFKDYEKEGTGGGKSSKSKDKDKAEFERQKASGAVVPDALEEGDYYYYY